MFKRFPSLTNHYQTTDIQKFLSFVDQPITYAVWEKLDGANFSVLLSHDHDPKYFSRNQEITGSDFYGAKDIIDDTVEFLVREYILNHIDGKSVRLFGELFGKGIQKRVDYGPDKRLLFFDVMIDDVLIPHITVNHWTQELGIDHLFVQPIGFYHDFDLAMDFDTKFNTHYGPKKDPMNMAEGVVIKPWNTVIFTPVGSVFYIKKKNEEFGDKKVREPKVKREYSEEVEFLRDEFMSYINENTMLSVFSKEGPMTESKEIGKYLPLIIKDAMDTFMLEQDYDPEAFEKEERKYIFNCAAEVATLLKNYLFSGK